VQPEAEQAVSPLSNDQDEAITPHADADDCIEWSIAQKIGSIASIATRYLPLSQSLAV
jgi:hypothetical protein